MDNTERAYKIDYAERILMSSDDSYKCMVLHVGTNELKDKEAEEIAAQLTEIVNLCKRKSDKVVISRIVPRLDDPHLAIKAQLAKYYLSCLCQMMPPNLVKREIFKVLILERFLRGILQRGLYI